MNGVNKLNYEDNFLLDLWRRAELLIFDFDGVLADSEPLYRESWNLALKPWNHVISEDDYWLYWSSLGEGLEGEMRRHAMSDIDPETAGRQQKQFYKAICTEGRVPLFTGAIELLERLQSGDEPGSRPTVIASNTSGELVKSILVSGGAQPPPIIGGKGLRKKPFPDIFLSAASFMNTDPADTLVFEDAIKGVLAAESGGFPVVHVENGLNRNILTGGLCGVRGIAHMLQIMDHMKSEVR